MSCVSLEVLQGIRQPARVRRKPWLLPNSARNGNSCCRRKGLRQVSADGSITSYQDFLAGKLLPVVILDPHGTTIDNFLDKVTYLAPEQQRTIADRLFYIDVSGKSGFVPSLPLYYRLPGDSLLQVAQRFLNVVKKLDPDLTSAPILGWNAISGSVPTPGWCSPLSATRSAKLRACCTRRRPGRRDCRSWAHVTPKRSPQLTTSCTTT